MLYKYFVIYVTYIIFLLYVVYTSILTVSISLLSDLHYHAD